MQPSPSSSARRTRATASSPCSRRTGCRTCEQGSTSRPRTPARRSHTANPSRGPWEARGTRASSRRPRRSRADQDRALSRPALLRRRTRRRGRDAGVVLRRALELRKGRIQPRTVGVTRRRPLRTVEPTERRTFRRARVRRWLRRRFWRGRRLRRRGRRPSIRKDHHGRRRRRDGGRRRGVAAARGWAPGGDEER